MLTVRSSAFVVVGVKVLLSAGAFGQTPVFEDSLRDASKISGQWGSGAFSANGYTLTHSGGTSTHGQPRSRDFVWYDLPGKGSDGTGSFEFDVTGLYPNAGCTGNEIAEACDSTGLQPATVKDDFWASPYAVMMRKINDEEWPTYTNKLKLSGRAGPSDTDWKAGFSPVLSWDGTVTYRFRVTWNNRTVKIWRGLPGQPLSVIGPSPWTLNNPFTPGRLHIELGSSFWTATTSNREFGGAPGTTYSLLRVYEEDLGGIATPPGGSVVIPTEVSIDLGTTNVEDGMTHPQVGDGDTTPATIGGRNCRQNVDPAQDFYFYFGISDAFAFQGSRPTVDITFDYYDTGTGTIRLQYDSASAAYTVAGTVTLTGDDSWKTAGFHVTDGYFGNRENGGSDLRIHRVGGGTFYIDTVRVSGPPAKAANPNPSHQATYVATDADLSWSAASGAASYDVYFGTTSPGAPRGNQTSTAFDPGPLAYDTTYCWRIDSVGANGTTTGDVWSFTTRPETPAGVTLGISSDSRFFTINGEPTFLHGVSYYGSQYITTGSFRTQDLDDMVADGFNWLRSWAYWAWPWTTGDNVSALDKSGNVREPYMSRLKTLIAECNARGIIVDVTMIRDTNNEWHSPTTLSQHLNAARTLATELLPYRNVYFDLANERDGNSVFVSFEEMGQLVNAVKAIDPGRLCTASNGGGLSSQSELNNYLAVGHVDFLAVHYGGRLSLPPTAFGEVQKYVGWMAVLGTRVPIHWQEPFRRDKEPAWQPVAEDFYRSETGVKLAEAAGWCFHNGGPRNDTRPFRSFNMSDPEGRLYAQLDSEERTACDNFIAQIGSIDLNVRRYQAEYDEQLSHAVGRKEGLAWSADVALDAAGLMTSGPLLDTVPAGEHVVKWRLMIDNNTADNEAVVTLIVRGGGGQLASRTLTRQEFTAVSAYQTFTLNFTSTGQQDIEFRTNWLDRASMKCDWVELTIGGGSARAPVIAEVAPDPVIARPGVPYIQALALVEGSPAPTWAVVQGPPGAQVDTGGVVSGWTPALDDLGSPITFEVRATNPEGSDTESWQVLVRSRADFDGDNDVDQSDFGHFQSCMEGGNRPIGESCLDADLDGDTDVDPDDLLLFLPCVGGPHQEPGC
ncbi:MAG: cellulase family glycosylhydrolase [Planctomycetes bacterium]|nr:cellulase family glycosylhydrolase [Planctomycetota bacterium]